MARARPDDGADALIRAYKLVLSQVLETRPSGTRQRLADALGKHRSFITQMSSPSYPTPIPQRHLPTILAVCHFSGTEREAFMGAYGAAHRSGPELATNGPKLRQMSLLVPELGDDKQNAALDRAVSDFVQRLTGLLRKGGEE